MKSHSGWSQIGLVAFALGLGACDGTPKKPEASPSPVVKKAQPTVDQVQNALAEATEKDRKKYADATFEEFEKSKAVYKEPFAGGKYIVNGDSTIVNEKQLRDFFEANVKAGPTNRLIVNRINGLDDVWGQDVKKKLVYCVSKPDFRQHYDGVVRDMAAATGAWQQVAAVAFQHDATQDDHCNASNTKVVFDVRPVDVGGEYLARAFFPSEPRPDRNVLIDNTAFDIPPTENPQLVGILRHELGHSLGFRHEHTRPSAGKCFEDSNWAVLTDYDPYSVMHYPQCNGKGDWSLNLTDRDKSGAACEYGAAPGFTINGALVTAATCTPDQVPPTAVAKVETFVGQSVAKDAEKKFPPSAPFAVAPGSLFTATMSGGGAAGDPDLYVKFDQAAARKAYDCRPYLVGPNETCSLNVPSGASKAYVMVRGYEAGTFSLKVTYFPPSH